VAIKETLPKTVWLIEVPERAEDIAKRWHNKYAKDALRETVERWHGHERGFKKHWRRDARQRYNHFPRSEKYKKMKARVYHSTVDLIKTGDTKEKMTHEYKITASGTAEGRTLRASLILRFPFKGGTGRFRKPRRPTRASLRAWAAIETIQKMKIELQRMDEEDPELLAKWFLEAYMKKCRDHRASRKRIRISR
jgi:hypothetical protein